MVSNSVLDSVHENVRLIYEDELWIFEKKIIFQHAYKIQESKFILKIFYFINVAMTSCTSLYPQLVKATLVSGMMPQLAKVFIAVQGQRFVTRGSSYLYFLICFNILQCMFGIKKKIKNGIYYFF